MFHRQSVNIGAYWLR